MPDFEAMSDAELRQFKSAKAAEIRAAREEMRAAAAVLEAKRVAADAKWRRAAEAARDIFRLGSNEAHDEKTRELFAMSDDDMDDAIEDASRYGTLSREERRALARAGSARIVVPPAGSEAGIPISDSGGVGD